MRHLLGRRRLAAGLNLLSESPHARARRRGHGAAVDERGEGGERADRESQADRRRDPTQLQPSRIAQVQQHARQHVEHAGAQDGARETALHQALHELPAGRPCRVRRRDDVTEHHEGAANPEHAGDDMNQSHHDHEDVHHSSRIIWNKATAEAKPPP